MRLVLIMLILSLAGCGTPPRHPDVTAAPGLSRPVPILTFYGNTISCQAAPGAVCVQR